MSPSRSPRIDPLSRESWNDEVRAALEAGFPEVAERFLSSGPDAMRLPNALGTMLHYPVLAGAFLPYNRVLLTKPLLGARARELMVLRVAWRTRSTYEWVQHTRMAVKLGVTTDEILAITQDTLDPSAWTPLEADLLVATDELIDSRRIEDGTWARLAQHLDAAELVEAVFIVGTYVCLAMVFNSFEVQLDPDLEPPEGIPVPEA